MPHLQPYNDEIIDVFLEKKVLLIVTSLDKSHSALFALAT